MTRFILSLSAAGFVWLAAAVAPASAQFAYPIRPPQYGPYYQTQLSPWLNMLRGGDPAANYYAGVNPEFQRRQDRNAIYNSLQNIGMQIPPPPGITNRELDLPLASTGHVTAFNYTGTYFGGNAATRSLSNPFPSRRGPTPGVGGAMGGLPGQGSGGVWPNMMMPSPGMGGGMPPPGR
jgi:hypothetical protein